MRKKQEVIILFAVLSLMCFSTVYAESCTIASRASCTGSKYSVAGISGTTDAHGELASEEFYNYVLCCDFGTGNLTCNGANKIIGLYSETNAHAEIPSLTNYDYDICYENLTCLAKTSCSSEEMTVLSLVNQTNAHIGGANDYSTKICCVGMCEEGEDYVGGNCVTEKMAYWSDGSGAISQKNVIIGSTTVTLKLENSLLSPGTQVTFSIYEKDLLVDDLIKTVSSTIDSNGDANASWTITQADLDATGETDFDEFYFGVDDEESNLLTLIIENATSCSYITLCGDYQNEEECGQDTCSVAEFSVESKNSQASCGEITYTSPGNCQMWSSCECEWRDNVCESKKVENIQENCEGDNPSIIGSCLFGESTTDNCNDGFLEYSWGAVWEWDTSNVFAENPGYDSYIQGEDLLWHYDPEGKSSSCTEGSKTVSCPAQVKLPFFNKFNFLITAILIVLIYILFRKRLGHAHAKAKKKKR